MQRLVGTSGHASHAARRRAPSGRAHQPSRIGRLAFVRGPQLRRGAVDAGGSRKAAHQSRSGRRGLPRAARRVSASSAAAVAGPLLRPYSPSPCSSSLQGANISIWCLRSGAAGLSRRAARLALASCATGGPGATTTARPGSSFSARLRFAQCRILRPQLDNNPTRRPERGVRGRTPGQARPSTPGERPWAPSTGLQAWDRAGHQLAGSQGAGERNPLLTPESQCESEAPRPRQALAGCPPAAAAQAA